jgi:transcription antitermination factor NusG
MPPFWCVARVASRLEAFVIERLEAEGFEAFAPKIHSANRRVIPLFFGYLFVHVVELWQPIARIHGVGGLIKFGDAPAKCPDAEIDQLRSRMDGDGVIVLPKQPAKVRFAKGDRILVTGGPLQGVRGLHSGMSAAQREIVLIDLLGRQTRTAIPSAFVAPQ